MNLLLEGVLALQKEKILRTQLDANTGLPRVGINRTGERINNISVISGGSGYTSVPSVQVGPPDVAGGVQCLASALSSMAELSILLSIILEVDIPKFQM